MYPNTNANATHHTLDLYVIYLAQSSSLFASLSSRVAAGHRVVRCCAPSGLVALLKSFTRNATVPIRNPIRLVVFPIFFALDPHFV